MTAIENAAMNLKKRKGVLLKITFFGALSFLFCLFLLALSGLKENDDSYDVAVVLGNKVELDGRPSPRLAARLDRAAELWNDQRLKMIIVSGGTGVEGFDEAVVMKDYLVGKGVPAEIILLDSEGIDSWSTAQNTKKFMDENGLKSAVVISQYFHNARCSLAFRRAGIKSVSSSYARYTEARDAYSLIRELPGYLSYWLWKAL